MKNIFWLIWDLGLMLFDFILAGLNYINHAYGLAIFMALLALIMAYLAGARFGMLISEE